MKALFRWKRLGSGCSRCWSGPRDEAEAEAARHRRAGDPELAELMRVVVGTALAWETDYWIACGLSWLTVDEVPVFATQLRSLAAGKRGSQTTRHAAKQLLKEYAKRRTQPGV